MAAGYDAGQMLINLSQSLPFIYRMVTGAAYLIGVGFMFSAFYHLKIYGDMRTMMATQAGLKQPVVYMFVGAVFMFIPTGFKMVMNTVFGYGNVLAYDQWPGGGGTDIGQPAITILRIIQLIGIIAFVKGWVYIARSSQQQAQGGMFGKGLIHVLGGIFCVNIVGTVVIVSNTFGIRF